CVIELTDQVMYQMAIRTKTPQTSQLRPSCKTTDLQKLVWRFRLSVYILRRGEKHPRGRARKHSTTEASRLISCLLPSRDPSTKIGDFHGNRFVPPHSSDCSDLTGSRVSG